MSFRTSPQTVVEISLSETHPKTDGDCHVVASPLLAMTAVFILRSNEERTAFAKGWAVSSPPAEEFG